MVAPLEVLGANIRNYTWLVKHKIHDGDENGECVSEMQKKSLLA
jgi:hypothetical protein